MAALELHPGVTQSMAQVITGPPQLHADQSGSPLLLPAQ